jgi:two-component system sensor histidine kinase DctS
VARLPRLPISEQPAALRAPSRWRRALPWVALLALLAVAQTLLVALTVRVEEARAQDDADAVAAAMAGDLRRELLGASRQLQALAFGNPPLADWRSAAATLLAQRPELRHIELRSPGGALVGVAETPYAPRLFGHLPRAQLSLEAEVTCDAARRAASPLFSRSYFVPQGGGAGQEVVDLCVPVLDGNQSLGYLVGSFALPPLLESVLGPRAALSASAQRYELSFVEGDGTRLARAGVARGGGVYVAERLVDLPGRSLQLRADSTAGRPSVIPNLATALVLGLSLALFAVVLLLARDVRRRAEAERALAEALAFRKAMEDSLSTGLRARDLQGVITYVNPAFCAMVGFSAAELLAPGTAQGATSSAENASPHTAPYTPPYWPPERVDDYRQRQQRLFTPASRPGPQAAAGAPPPPGPETREGHETLFMRKSGERFPVMVYEAPLVDGQGRHTGWMSAVVDISAQRRVEELSRQQQDRLQATARLATVGEMASLMSHELNQPLAAIASYAAGTLNLLDAPPEQALPPAEERGLLRQAVARMGEQAERAGRIIKSVHGFVRRREQQHETLGVDLLVEAVLPLVRLQARKSGTRIEVDIAPVPAHLQPPEGAGTAPAAAGRLPRVRCDRTMIEQVLLNLTRNGIQAMEAATPLEARSLTLRVRQTHERWVTFSIIDAGPGISAEVAQRLFTPFFTTREEGMGLGLSLCRTVVEQHGGALDYGPGPLGAQPRGTEFRFTLPTPRPAAGAGAPPPRTAPGTATAAPAEVGDTAGLDATTTR